MNKQHKLYREDIDWILSVRGMEGLRGSCFLITGATGLIGVPMIDALMSLGGVRVIAVGRDVSKARERLGEYFRADGFTFVEHDVCEAFDLASLPARPDVVVPLASMTHPLAYSQYPVSTLLVNIKGAEHALRLAVESNATVLYPSTVEIYGNARGDDVFTEDYTGALNLSNARSCYPESKRTCEALCQSFMAEQGISVKIVRLSRVFGPTILQSDSKASSQFLRNAVAGEDIVLKSPGEQYFSYTYVADAVAAMFHVLLHGRPGVPYNISNPECDVRLRDFAGFCAAFNGKSVVFDLPTDAESRGFSIASRAILDGSRLRDIGFSARFPIAEAIRRTIVQLR